MATKPFKFRYVNEITGVFVLLIVALLIAGVILAGRAQGWFEAHSRLTLLFPEEGSLGVQEGTRIFILQTPVGAVDRMIVQADGRMEAQARIKGDFYHWFVRQDSRAVVKKAFGVAGETYVEITRGRGAPLPREGAKLTCINDVELIQLAQNILKQVSGATVEYTRLAADLRNPDGPLMQLLGHLNQLAAGLEKGEGPAGLLLRDPATAKQISASLAEVRRILADVRQATDQLPAMAKTVGGEVRDASGLVLQTQSAIREAEKLIAGIERNWLVRRYIPQAEPSTRIPPQAVPDREGGP